MGFGDTYISAPDILWFAVIWLMLDKSFVVHVDNNAIKSAINWFADPQRSDGMHFFGRLYSLRGALYILKSISIASFAPL